MEKLASYDKITPDFLEAFLAKYDEAWKSSSGSEMAALCSENVIWDDPALAEPAHGPIEVAEYIRWNFTVYPNLRFEAPDPPAISVDGKLAYLRWILKGTNTGPIDPPGFAATGRSVEVPGVDEYRFRDGLLARYHAYYDMHDMLTQLGVTPARDSRMFKTVTRLQRVRMRIGS